MQGYLPVVEIMFADFVTLAFDQICNHAVKFPGMFPDTEIPLVIRTPAGGRRGYGPTHSQNPETLLCAVPGLTVVFPSARHLPGDLLWNSVFRWPYPVVFLEHKLLYKRRCRSSRLPCWRAGIPEDRRCRTYFPTLVGGDADPDVTCGGLRRHGGIWSEVGGR